MKLVVKLKNGNFCTINNVEQEPLFTQTNLVELIQTGTAKNADVTLNDNSTGQQIKAKWSDVYSLELVV
jgi:hypothetical protein